jgi:excisionase family DNA binding protein
MSAVEKWPEFLTVPEVAQILRVSKMTVYRMVHRTELESTRVGRSFRISSASLDAYLRSQEVTA